MKACVDDFTRMRRIALIVVGGLLVAALWWGMLEAESSGQTRESWLQIPYDLSGTASLVSAYPDIEANDDYVVVVWSDGYSSSPAAKHLGTVRMAWVTPSEGVWHRQVIEAGEANGSVTNYLPAVALVSDTVHIVWVRSTSEVFQIRYRSCTLGGSCSGIETLDEIARGTNGYVQSPDVAANSNVVYAAWVYNDGSESHIWAKYKVGSGGWTDAAQVSKDILAKDDYQQPKLALGTSKAHLVWIQRQGGQGIYVHYSSKDLTSGLWASQSTVGLGSSSEPVANPTIALKADDDLYVIWDQTLNTGGFYLPYTLQMKRWNGSLWGGQYSIPGGSTVISYTGGSGIAEEYYRRLRPAAVVDGDGWLHVVWHTGNFDGRQYHVLYSYSTNPQGSPPTWTDPVTVTVWGAETVFGCPDIAMGQDGAGNKTPYFALQVKGTAADVWYTNFLGPFYRAFLPVTLRNGP